MRRIVAIGGGEIGRPGFPVETTAIDKETIRLTRKKHPKVLFLPTASSDSEAYFEVVKKHFGERLGCKVDVLYLLKMNISKKQIEAKVCASDIIYVGGGNTLKMLKAWRSCGLDKIFLKALRNGTVLSGVSAGAVCWFSYANSDSRKMRNTKAPYIRIKGLGVIPALLCPHFDAEPGRYKSLPKMMKRTKGVCIAIDNCAALEIINDTYRIIRSKTTARVQKMFWKRGHWHEEIIPCDGEFRQLDGLLSK